MLRAIVTPALAWLAFTATHPARERAPSIDGSFSFSLQQHRDAAVHELVLRWRERAAVERASELRDANENPFTEILELTSYSPIRLSSGDDRVDTFFLHNYSQYGADALTADPLSLSH